MKTARKERKRPYQLQRRKQMTISIDPDVLEACESLATEGREKRNTLIQRVLIEYLKKEERWPPKAS